MSMANGAENNSLNHILDPDKYHISSIDTDIALASIPPNRWGYNVPVRDGDTYKALPNKTPDTQEQHTLKVYKPEEHEGRLAAKDTTDINFATKVDTNIPSGSYSNTVLYTATANTPPTPYPKAILSTTGNLNFVYDTSHYNKGDIYADNLSDHAEIKEVYDDEHASEHGGVGFPYKSTSANNVPWAGGKKDPETGQTTYRPDITSVNFIQNFYNYPVASTAYWFQNDRYISSITNIANLNPTAEENVSMASMFNATGSEVTEDFTLNLTGFNTQKASNMTYMFAGAGYNATTTHLELSEWDTGNVTSMNNMFNEVGRWSNQVFIKGIKDWNVGNVLNMSWMFACGNGGYYPTAPEIWTVEDLSNWDTHNVTDMSSMFFRSGVHSKIWNVGRLDNWDTHNVTNMSSMFYEAGVNAPNWSVGDLSRWNTSKVTNMSSMFANNANDSPAVINWSIGDISNWNVSNVTDMSSMFLASGRDHATSWYVGKLDNWDTHNVTNMSSMFYNTANKAAEFRLDLSRWDVSNVTNMSSMFGYVYNNVSTSPVWTIGNLNNWNVGNVTNMSNMFAFSGGTDPNWSLGDLGNWDVSNVTTMGSGGGGNGGMFQSAGRSATHWSIGNLHKWNTSKVTNMAYMFRGTGGVDTNFSLEGIDQWDTSHVTSMWAMFQSAGTNATTWSVGSIKNWNINKVTNMQDMFSGAAQSASNLNLDLSIWNTSSVVTMNAMFRQFAGMTTDAKLDLSGWNTSNVTDMTYMFNGAVGLKTVYVGSGWVTRDDAQSSRMFGNNFSYALRQLTIKGGKGTLWSSAHIEKEYARIDQGPDSDSPGYFTNKNDPGPPPSPTPPPSDDSNGGSGGNVALTFLSNPNNNSTATTSSDMSSTNGYSNPQGALSSKHVIPGTSSPNWFLFILLLTLSILTLGISLFIFYKKRKAEQESL